MGFTSKQIDEEINQRDFQLMIALDGAYQEKEMRKLSIAVARGYAGDVK